jgi:predicted nucleic acid-binding protein
MAAERVVVDTWGWLSLADDREPRHSHVRQIIVKLGYAGETAVTTDYILDETLTFERWSLEDTDPQQV